MRLLFGMKAFFLSLVWITVFDGSWLDFFFFFFWLCNICPQPPWFKAHIRLGCDSAGTWLCCQTVQQSPFMLRFPQNAETVNGCKIRTAILRMFPDHIRQSAYQTYHKNVWYCNSDSYHIVVFIIVTILCDNLLPSDDCTSQRLCVMQHQFGEMLQAHRHNSIKFLWYWPTYTSHS